MTGHDSSVNYIRHLTEVFIKIGADDRLTPSHISLYISLFQIWNLNRFANPLLIIRSELMQVSKIASKSTYHRCMKGLHEFGYIEYYASRSPYVGSKVKMLSHEQVKIKVKNPEEYHHSPISGHVNGHDSSKYGHVTVHESPTGGHLNEPFNKHINNSKHINLLKEQNEFCTTAREEKLEEEIPASPKSVKSKFTPPPLEEIQQYFQEKNKPDLEAQKFFNHFESNGWKIGGRSPMKNWKAAANNWMLNCEKFNPVKQTPVPDNLNTNQDKDYSMPL